MNRLLRLRRLCGRGRPRRRFLCGRCRRLLLLLGGTRSGRHQWARSRSNAGRPPQDGGKLLRRHHRVPFPCVGRLPCLRRRRLGLSLGLLRPRRLPRRLLSLRRLPRRRSQRLTAVAIRLKDETAGHILVGEAGESLDTVEVAAVEQAALVFALEILKERSAFEADRRVSGEALRNE